MLFLTIVLLAPTAQANLLTNGGFEDPDIPDGDWGTALPTGWVVVGSGALQDQWPEGETYYTPAHEGEQCMDMWASGGDTSVTQDVTHTILADTTYTLTAWLYQPWWDSSNSSFTLEIGWDGWTGSVSSGSTAFTAGDNWTEFNFDLDTAVTTDAVGATEINARVTVADGGDLFLDGVSLVPEPATMLLLGLGGMLIRRRRK